MNIDSPALAEHILKKSNPKSTYTGQDLTALTSVKALNALLIYNLKMRWELEADQLRSPYFNYHNEQVKAAQAKFLNILSQNILLNEKTATDLLKNAVEDYLIADIDFIRFVAEKLEPFAKPAIPLHRVAELAKYSPTNRSSLEVIVGELKSFGKTEVLKGDLQMALMQRRNRQELNPANTLITTLLSAYSDFAVDHQADILVSETESEPINFFDAIDFDGETELDSKSTKLSDLSIVDAENVIEIDELIFRSDVKIEPQQSDIAQPQLETAVTEILPLLVVNDSKEDDLWQTERAKPKHSDIQSKLKEMPRALNFEHQGENLAEKLNRTSSGTGSLLNRISRSPLADLGRTITLAEKELFVTQVFGGDRRSYTNVLARLESSTTRQDAEAYLHGEMLTSEQRAFASVDLLQTFERIVLRKFNT